MPRKARIKSRTSVYHVMIRGINRQNLFEENEDYLRFIEILKKCKEISGFKLYAFCLMSNHVHLLLQEGEEPLGLIFKRIGSRYVHWYNEKYQRVGHLFQDRFRSENVEDHSYFLTVLRYIIQNPMKAELEEEPGEYQWSSFTEYVSGRETITDTEMAIDAAGSKEALVTFLKEKNDDQAMDEKDRPRHITDDEARRIMNDKTGCTSVADYQMLPLNVQRCLIVELYRSGASPTQMIRLTGKAKASVYKIIQSADSE